jgi:phosphoglycolate phosphatase
MSEHDTVVRPSAVAFDLDGTLVDSAPDIAAALNAALCVAGLPQVALERVRAWIGDGPDPLISRALAALGQADAAGLHAALRQQFDRATLAAPLAQGRVFDGIEALLRQLHPIWPLLVVTNKPSALAAAVLEAAGLRGYFTAVYGADTAALRKPAPAMLQCAARELGCAAHRLLMVGDSAPDMAAAAAAGTPAVWAGWGYGQPASLPAAPCWHIAHPAQLAGLLGIAR